MDNFNLKEAVEQSLQLLEQRGASAKMLKEYRTTGFGAGIRHFTLQGMLMMLLSEYLGHASEETTKIYAYADTEMKRAAINKVDIVRGDTPLTSPIWENDEEMILKLSGLL